MSSKNGKYISEGIEKSCAERGRGDGSSRRRPPPPDQSILATGRRRFRAWMSRPLLGDDPCTDDCA